MAWEWERVSGPDGFAEGPAWDGNGLFFSVIIRDEIRRYDPVTGRTTTVYRNTRAANGLLFAPDGTLLACEGTGGRAIVRYDRDGQRHVLVDRHDGQRLNSPNDLALAPDGTIWFTDPRYGDDHSDRELDHDSVYRLDPAASDGGRTLHRVTFDTTRPNGILLSADGGTLYVAQSDYDPGSVRQLRAYPVGPDGMLGAATVLHDFGEARGIDGMAFDADGNIVAACGWEVSGPGSRVTVFAPDGTVLDESPLPEARPTNCAFGGEDLTDLYVTATDGGVWRVRGTGRSGLLQPPEERPFTGA
ncbi:MAG TPA: SMP-30/gluconolactonase/LRE family protein [Thermomicrobiales bacterium]|jgi:gluconolactonase|nr:SMP-30/gluconolactonase/LRE family protein [Thermomicrobiales bacterium]